MYALRLTRTLLGRDAPDPAAADPATTTRLGDWYVQPLDVGQRRLLLCTSEYSLLSVVLPAATLDALPEHLGVGLVSLLRALAIPERAIAAEIDEMADGVLLPTASRRVLGAMRGTAAQVTRVVEASGRRVDVSALHRALAARRSRAIDGRTPAEIARLRLQTAGPSRRGRDHSKGGGFR